MSTPDFDLVVLGGGTAGLISAAVAGYLGARTALIEGVRLGGDCLNSGCVPSKALIRGARGEEELRWLNREGLLTASVSDILPNTSVSFSRVMERMRTIREEISHHDSAARFRDEFGVTVFEDHGVFTAANRIALSRAQQEITFRRCIIATGATSAIPPVPGLTDTAYLTNETLFELNELPKHLIILGAGAIGCEMAQAFVRLGSTVTMVDAEPGILPREDPAVGELLAERLQEEGVTLHTGVTVTHVAQQATLPREDEPRGTGVVLTLMTGSTGTTTPSTELVITGSHLLVATGRTPRVDGIGLDAAGVRCTIPQRHQSGPQPVAVDSWLRTTNRRIFAAGDVAGAWNFTHAAEATAAIAVQNALFFCSPRTDKLLVPRCTFTTPEVAQVGLTQKDAAMQGILVDSYTHSFSTVDRARIDGTTAGFVQLLTKHNSSRLLGATVVGAQAGEIIPTIALAMRHRLGIHALGSLIFPYPTLAEAVKRAAAGYRKDKLTVKRKRLLQGYMRLRRSLPG